MQSIIRTWKKAKNFFISFLRILFCKYTNTNLLEQDIKRIWTLPRKWIVFRFTKYAVRYNMLIQYRYNIRYMKIQDFLLAIFNALCINVFFQWDVHLLHCLFNLHYVFFHQKYVILRIKKVSEIMGNSFQVKQMCEKMLSHFIKVFVYIPTMGLLNKIINAMEKDKSSVKNFTFYIVSSSM